MVEFAGWSMPIQYNSIVEEHLATRSAVGLFDISHMARFRLDGPNALAFLDKFVTRKVADLRPSRIRYALVCQEDGGILDDVLVYHLQEDDGASYAWMVVNASNREKIATWLQTHLSDTDGVRFTDVTEETSMIALQGPQAMRIARETFDLDFSSLKYYQATSAKIAETAAMVSRTGYTGEDGVELTIPNAVALSVWEQLHAAAEKIGGKAVGLGARDTLRLEAGMPLYGHELSETISPVQAGLEFAISWDHDFVGKAALHSQRDARLSHRVGLVMEGKRVPRENYHVFAGDQDVGVVTSGSFSPTLNRPIAMAYVDAANGAPAETLQIDIRGKRHPAQVVELPFYQRSRS